MGTTGQSITLANSIIGVGILAMPFCFQQCGVLLASLILILMGLVSRLSSYFLLKSAFITKRRNFEFLAFHAFGSAGKLAVEVGIIGFLMGTCIAYFVVVGDLGPQIIAKLLNINQSDILRTSIMVIVSVVCVLPLGLLRNVDSLSNVSAATIGFYFCLVMKVIVEAASQLLTHDWYERVELWKPAGVLQCVPIFSMALFCQTQLFEIFESLPTLSMEKMNVVTKNAINICTSMYFTLGLFGYIAFCSQEISGNVLVSLSPTMGSDVIKLGFVMSLAFSFPLIIFPCRASLYSFLYKKVHSYHHDHIVNHSIPETSFRCITVVIIAVALVVGLLIPNIELVLGLLGSTIGVMICVIFPAACFVHVTFKDTNERLLAKLLLVLGLVIMVLGTYANLQAADKLERIEDKITPESIDKIVQDFFDAKKSEESEEVILKPLTDQRGKPDEAVKDDPDIMKDSEVQPPNPVPPESVSNEKVELKQPEVKHINDNNLKEVLPDDKIKVLEVDDKISDVNSKSVNDKIKEEKLNINVDKVNMQVEKAKPEAKVKPQEKNDLEKQKELIETIKQHGEEQKELMKEQKEILSELKKTQEEMKQSKKEEATNEAKKIAVESIQKIANMAIQSLSGVSDMPAVPEKKPLEKTADEAVKEIAKKAVETIEAIKEIKENPKDTLNKIDALINSNTQNNAANLIPKAPVPIQSNVPNVNQQNIQNLPSNVQPNVPNVNLPNVPIQSHNQNIPLSNSNQGIPSNPNQQINVNKNVPSNINTNKIEAPHPDQKHIQQVNLKDKTIEHEQAVNNVQNINAVKNEQISQSINQAIDPKASDNKKLKPINEHSHSPDEPQSYKEGEDAQKNIILNNIAQNLPLPIAINSNSDNIGQIKPIIQENKLIENKIVNIPEETVVQNNGIKPQNTINQQNVDAHRQKREVVDCTQKTTLKPEDKAICMSLFSDVTEDILKNVDLNDQLQRKLPLDPNSIHHIRSLKSFDDSEKR